MQTSPGVLVQALAHQHSASTQGRAVSRVAATHDNTLLLQLYYSLIHTHLPSTGKHWHMTDTGSGVAMHAGCPHRLQMSGAHAAPASMPRGRTPHRCGGVLDIRSTTARYSTCSLLDNCHITPLWLPPAACSALQVHTWRLPGCP